VNQRRVHDTPARSREIATGALAAADVLVVPDGDAAAGEKALGKKGVQALRKPDDSKAGSNVGIGIPRFVNEGLAAIFSSEARLLRYISAPAGHSLVMVARKPG